MSRFDAFLDHYGEVNVDTLAEFFDIDKDQAEECMRRVQRSQDQAVYVKGVQCGVTKSVSNRMRLLAELASGKS